MQTYDELKAYQRAHREGFPDALGLRVHRALSWLRRAELCDDQDGRFIFLWIAFNAAYAQDLTHLPREAESQRFQNFVSKLVSLDTENVLYELMWSEYSGSIRLLLDNQYLFQPYWDHVNDRSSSEDWEKQFVRFKRAAHAHLARRDTAKLFGVVSSPLYTLRNQLVHGGATWGSSVNRDQVRDCAGFMGKVVPRIIHLMMLNPGELWGSPCYPVITN